MTVAAIVAAIALAFGGAEEHTVTGDLTLYDVSTVSLAPGDACYGDGGYDDINAGSQVVLEDEAGATLATSSLGPGQFDGLGCVFDFTFEAVPEARFYRVSAGREVRGGTRYSYDEMVDAAWSVHLTLG